jgi:hypothetical protein
MDEDAMFPQLKVHLYSRPLGTVPGLERTIDGICWPTLQCDALATSQFPSSFEEVAERLQQFDRMYFEYDGSFVWTGRSDEEESRVTWQLDGMLYDYGGRLQRVELLGTCPWPQWQALVSAVAPPPENLLVHFIEQHCFVPAEALERLWSLPHA